MEFRYDHKKINTYRTRVLLFIALLLILLGVFSFFIYGKIIEKSFISRDFDEIKVIALTMAAAIPFLFWLLILLARRWQQYFRKVKTLDQHTIIQINPDFDFAYQTENTAFTFRLTDLVAVENYYFIAGAPLNPFNGKGFLILYLKNNNKIVISSVLFKNNDGFYVGRKIFSDKPISYSEKKLNWMKRMEE